MAFSFALVSVRVPESVIGEPETENSAGAASPTLFTDPLPPPPLDADVMRPCESTVMFALVYVPGDTAVFASAIVPDVVIVPPERPVPALTDVTVPVPPAVVGAQFPAPE